MYLLTLALYYWPRVNRHTWPQCSLHRDGFYITHFLFSYIIIGIRKTQMCQSTANTCTTCGTGCRSCLISAKFHLVVKKFGCWIQISVKLYFQACKNLLESLCLPNKTKPSVQSTLSDQTRSLLHGLLETSGDLWRLLETFWDFWIIITEFLAPFLYFYGFINMDNFTTEQIHCP